MTNSHITNLANAITNKINALVNNHNNSLDAHNTLFGGYVRNNDLLDIIYPVGSIYISVNSTSPSLLFGGRWVQIKDRFLLASGSTYSAGDTGGSATVSLTEAQMPRHTHIQNSHTHTQNAHSHKATSTGRSVVGIDGTANWGYSSKLKIGTGSSGNAYYYPHSDVDTNGITEPTDTGSTTATNQSTTATNKYAGGTGSSESASNGSAHNNMPPYLAVYAWKRIEDYDYIVSTVSELTNALNNISDGESLYINTGTYTLSDQYSLPTCTIEGNNATINEIGLLFDQDGDSEIDISGITFDGGNVQNMRPLIDINISANVHIHNCTFTNKRADWNGDNICLHRADENNSIEIDHCSFTGDNYCNGYGHSKASIIYFGNDGYNNPYNISIHHNTFNHNENVGDSGNLYNGRAICFISSTLHNCIAYCNTYIGSEDTNNGIRESQCPD